MEGIFETRPPTRGGRSAAPWAGAIEIGQTKSESASRIGKLNDYSSNIWIWID